MKRRATSGLSFANLPEYMKTVVMAPGRSILGQDHAFASCQDLIGVRGRDKGRVDRAVLEGEGNIGVGKVDDVDILDGKPIIL